MSDNVAFHKPAGRDGRPRGTTLAEKAYQLILDQILRGALPISSVVSRRQLAEQLGMSFIPVAEALQRLENEGLVESKPRAGTRVRVPSPEEVRGRFEVREALECQGARLCAVRASFQERLELRRSAENVDALSERVAADEVDNNFAFAAQKYHVDFHMQIADCAHSPALRDSIEKSHVLIFNWVYNTASGVRSLPSHFHATLVGEIASGDPERAEKAMREHVRYGLERVVQTVGVNLALTWRSKRAK